MASSSQVKVRKVIVEMAWPGLELIEWIRDKEMVCKDGLCGIEGRRLVVQSCSRGCYCFLVSTPDAAIGKIFN